MEPIKKIRAKCCEQFDGTVKQHIMDHGKHYAKGLCTYCGHFTKWLPNPKITEENRLRSIKCDEMIARGESVYNQHELLFLENIKGSRFMTPKQWCFYNTMLTKSKSE